jgi:hypothetical protein
MLKRRAGCDILGGNDIQRRAVRRSQIRRALSETIFKSVAEYMARENIGFNELTRRLQMSSATTSKIPHQPLLLSSRKPLTAPEVSTRQTNSTH